MATTTTYDVLLRYRIDNKAMGDADKFRQKLGEAQRGAEGLGGALAHVGAIMAGAFSIHSAWEHLVMFNKEVENAKISLTAMVEGGFGGNFDYARGQAESLYNEFQKFSQMTPMTTQEMLEFSRGVAVSTQQAGGSIKDIVTITEQGAVAAKALGMESHYASRELSEMLAGNINNRMLFAKQLAGLGGKTVEDLRGMKSGERLAFLKATLTSPAMKDAVGAMSQSFSGVTSTLIDKVQILLGKIGLPLFKAITAEVTRWNEWIDKNSVSIDHFAKTVAEGLVSAFMTIRDVFGFIWDHHEMFIAIAKAWAIVKIGNMAGMGGLGSLAGNLGSSISGSKGLGFGQVLGPALSAGLGGYELAKAVGLDDFGKSLGGMIFDMTHSGKAQRDAFERLTKSTEELEKAQADAAARAGGVVTSKTLLQGTIDQAYITLKTLRDQHTRSDGSAQSGWGDEISAAQSRYSGLSQKMNLASMMATSLAATLEQSSLTEYQRQTLNETKAGNDIFTYINRHLSSGLKIDVNDMLNILRGNTADPTGEHKSMTEKPKVNVTIHRIEVQSDDPDRFVFGMVQSFRDAAKNPSSALSTLREG